MDNMISEKQIEKIVRKNTHFKLDTDWLLVEPIDYEHKYYVLMDFMKFCDTQIENFELYPLFSEISLHLANLQAISNESKYITIDKNFKTSDDEILITDLKFNDVPHMEDDVKEEFEKVLKFCGPKIFEYFNLVKAIWTLTYDSISINLNNPEDCDTIEEGFFFYVKNGQKFIWKYLSSFSEKSKIDTKIEVEIIFSGKDRRNPKQILDKLGFNTKFAIFEMDVKNELPLENTILPVFKRKILSYITQTRMVNAVKKLNP